MKTCIPHSIHIFLAVHVLETVIVMENKIRAFWYQFIGVISHEVRSVHYKNILALGQGRGIYMYGNVGIGMCVLVTTFKYFCLATKYLQTLVLNSITSLLKKLYFWLFL